MPKCIRKSTPDTPKRGKIGRVVSNTQKARTHCSRPSRCATHGITRCHRRIEIPEHEESDGIHMHHAEFPKVLRGHKEQRSAGRCTCSHPSWSETTPLTACTHEVSTPTDDSAIPEGKPVLSLWPGKPHTTHVKTRSATFDDHKGEKKCDGEKTKST